MNTFQTLAIFTYPHEYAVLKTLLQEAGLNFFFENEMMIGITPFYSNALGGIPLKVHHKDVEEAQQILNDLNDSGELHVVR